MQTEHIAQTLVSRMQANGMQVNQVTAQDGNAEINIQAKDSGLKSITIKMEEVSRPLVEDFDLLGPDEGFVDHVDYTPAPGRELVSVADDEM